MIPELGQFCLCLALLTSLLQAAVPLLQRFIQPHRIMGLTRPLAAISCLLMVTAFTCLVASYVQSDFSVLNVVENSHSAKPLLYKIVGAWGNHEGSMLLWMLVLSSCGLVIALGTPRDAALRSITLAVLGAISAGFLAFITFTSNPFLRVWPMPVEGNDLNPILQDIGLALHPPTLYVGYVGFGVVFAYAIAGMLRGRIDRDWAVAARPWILFPWCALTLGIGAGAWWAYRELGWGGWWFWDPVENVSLLPWLSGTALLHSNLVLERRGTLARWVALLAILTFSLSLVGTFIVRSGLITSVHAFAVDPARGMFILAYIVLVTGVALAIYLSTPFALMPRITLLSRSGLILINNLLLMAATGTVLLAILYPLLLQLMGAPGVAVGPSYFNRTFLPIAAPLPFLAALAPLLAWDRSRRSQLVAHLKALAPVLLVAGVIAFAWFDHALLLGFAGIILAFWLMGGTLRSLHRQLRAKALTLRVLGGLTAHAGLAVLVLGITLTGLLKQQYEAPIQPGKPIDLGSYRLTLEQVSKVEEHTYTARRARFQLSQHGQVITHLTPELRDYPVRNMQTTEAALYSLPWRDLYLVLGDSSYEGASRLGVRLYVTPGQQLIWAGFLLAAFGGGLALLAHLLPRRSRA